MDIKSSLLQIIKEENIFENEPLSSHTSFKIGGNADFLVMPENEEELISLIKYLKKDNINFSVIGNGSNLLVNDDGYRGVIIKTSGSFNKITVSGNIVEAQAGALLSKIAVICRDNSLDNFSELSGIPGSIGGALTMNAGAYGREMKDVVKTARILTDKGEVKTLLNSELNLSYRHSIISEENYIVLSVTLELPYGNKEEIADKMREVTKKRVGKQPLEFPSAGSTFKRPCGYYAAQLIEEAGLKGFRVGGASVSEKHSGFVINDNNASFKDVIELTDKIKEKVKEKYNVDLELEVKIL